MAEIQIAHCSISHSLALISIISIWKLHVIGCFNEIIKYGHIFRHMSSHLLKSKYLSSIVPQNHEITPTILIHHAVVEVSKCEVPVS